jgi:Zn finger protein HypA/HybF involved in hydrogenase expression
MNLTAPEPETNAQGTSIRVDTSVHSKKPHACDRCGTEMREKNCKITCPNCGNRFDCSDLNIYFD